MLVANHTLVLLDVLRELSWANAQLLNNTNRPFVTKKAQASLDIEDTLKEAVLTGLNAPLQDTFHLQLKLKLFFRREVGGLFNQTKDSAHGALVRHPKSHSRQLLDLLGRSLAFAKLSNQSLNFAAFLRAEVLAAVAADKVSATVFKLTLGDIINQIHTGISTASSIDLELIRMISRRRKERRYDLIELLGGKLLARAETSLDTVDQIHRVSRRDTISLKFISIKNTIHVNTRFFTIGALNEVRDHFRENVLGTDFLSVKPNSQTSVLDIIIHASTIQLLDSGFAFCNLGQSALSAVCTEDSSGRYVIRSVLYHLACLGSATETVADTAGKRRQKTATHSTHGTVEQRLLVNAGEVQLIAST